nr:hypothetical protein [Dyella ginsengisoli]
MSRYTISESVGSRTLPVHSYEDLHRHHPSSGREPNRQYGTVHGELEEIRRVDGRVFVKKDFVLAQDAPGPVEIPAPVSGYAHFLHDTWNTVQIYDKPYGTPGARREGQVLHMVRGSSPFGEGAHINYGQPLGEMGQTGSPGSIHAHVELEVGQFERYISDINNGTIRPGVVPRPGSGGTTEAAADVLEDGSRGHDVTRLQQQLAQLGYHGTARTARRLRPMECSAQTRGRQWWRSSMTTGSSSTARPVRVRVPPSTASSPSTAPPSCRPGSTASATPAATVTPCRSTASSAPRRPLRYGRSSGTTSLPWTARSGHRHRARWIRH